MVPLPAIASPKVSAVIPACNEQPTIVGVIRPLLAHPAIDEVIVVDDGSTDGTAEQARSLGVTVISLQERCGKASAMARGVAAVRNDVVFFCDADVIGLGPDAITRIVTPVASGDFIMYVGIRGRRTYWANRLLRLTPILGGERALRRALWDRVPPGYKRNFQIEIALNFFAKQDGHRMGFTVVHGLTQVIKERKRGLVPGLGQRLAMIGDILLVSWRIYAVLQLQLVLERVLRQPKST